MNPAKAFAALFLSFVLPTLAAEEAAIIKKGIGLGGDPTVVEKQLKALNVGWHYNWSASWKGRDVNGVAYVPMIFRQNEWAVASLEKLGVPKSKMQSRPLLGYNEPDGKEQGNMTVEQALKFWPELEKTNRRLGSPAAVHPDNEWMTSFMKGAAEKKPRVDFVCVHWYGPRNADKFIARIKEIHGLYKKPIWITEFAIADWSAKTLKDNRHSPRDVLEFMEDVLPELEKLDFVERYAWFPGKPGDPRLGHSALFDKQGNLTELGQFYSKFGRAAGRSAR